MKRRLEDELLGLLASGEAWTGWQLAQALSCSLRSVRRALATLREQGVQVDSDTGAGGGLRLRRGAGLPRVRLDHTEVTALLLALSLAESLVLPLLGQGLAPLRRKLAGAYAVPDRSALTQLRRRLLVGAPASPAVLANWSAPSVAVSRVLQQAFMEMRCLSLSYRDAKGAPSRRFIEPQALLLNHPAWYLVGFDRDRSAARTFRIDRIAHAELSPERFALRDPPTLLDGVSSLFQPV